MILGMIMQIKIWMNKWNLISSHCTLPISRSQEGNKTYSDESGERLYFAAKFFAHSRISWNFCKQIQVKWSSDKIWNFFCISVVLESSCLINWLNGRKKTLRRSKYLQMLINFLIDGANANSSLSFGSNFYLNPAGFDLYSPNTIRRSNKQCGSTKIGFSLNSGKADFAFPVNHVSIGKAGSS